MNPPKWHIFEFKGHKLIAVPKLPDEESHQACLRCIRNNAEEGFRCMDLPACAGLYFQFADRLTPEDSARFVIHKLEGETT